MIYEFPLTVNPNTTEANATETVMVLAAGTITFFGMEFPPGCAALTNIVIYEKTVKLWPSNPEGSFASDNQYLRYYPNYPLTKAPYVLTAKMWNDDERFDHTPIIRFEVVARGNTLIEKMIRLFAIG